MNSVVNACCNLKSGKIVLLEKCVNFTEKNETIVIRQYFLRKNDLHIKPCTSSSLGIYLVKNLSGLESWPINMMHKKYVILPMNANYIVFHNYINLLHIFLYIYIA